jgi:integrase
MAILVAARPRPQIGHHKPAAVRRARTAAGIPRGTTHALRHLFCSFMANNNVPPFQVMMILGHGSLDIVLVYYHLDRKQLLHTPDGLPFAQLQGKEADLAKSKQSGRIA